MLPGCIHLLQPNRHRALPANVESPHSSADLVALPFLCDMTRSCMTGAAGQELHNSTWRFRHRACCNPRRCPAGGGGAHASPPAPPFPRDLCSTCYPLHFRVPQVAGAGLCEREQNALHQAGRQRARGVHRVLGEAAVVAMPGTDGGRALPSLPPPPPAAPHLMHALGCHP